MKRHVAGPQSRVPFLHKKRIEEEASLVLAEWEQEHGDITDPPIPIDEIIELQLKLTMEFKDMRQLFPFGDVLGALWMEERLVGISQDLDPMEYPYKVGRYHFTLAHEVGHWRLHRPYYLENPYQGALFGDGPKPAAVCRSGDAREPVEWQANHFAACLLMPRRLVQSAWVTWRGDPEVVSLADLRRQTGGTGAGSESSSRTAAQKGLEDSVMEAFCRPLAGQFKASPEAMRIRLEELGYLVREKSDTLF